MISFTLLQLDERTEIFTNFHFSFISVHVFSLFTPTACCFPPRLESESLPLIKTAADTHRGRQEFTLSHLGASQYSAPVNHSCHCWDPGEHVCERAGAAAEAERRVASLAFISQSGDWSCQLGITSFHLLCCFLCLSSRQAATERTLLTPPRAPTST